MDLQEIKTRALAAREFVKTINGRSFTVRTPTKHDTMVVVGRLGASLTQNVAGLLLMQRALLEQALVAWSGVTVGDLLPDKAARKNLTAEQLAEPVPHTPEAVPLLLDAQPKWSGEIGSMLTEKIATRNSAIEGEQKN